MRVLLTGGSGMVGRNFLEHNGVQSEFEVLAPGSNEIDLRDYDQVYEYLQKKQPDFVVHAAGRVGGIQANIREPVRFLLDNLDMGRNIIWASHNAGIKRLLNLGSSCMYPRNAPNPLKEEMILQGELEPTNEGYALAKVVTARLCQYIMKEESSCHYKTALPCNLYGRHDKFDPEKSHLIPAIILKVHSALLKNESSVEIWGDGLAHREFMYSGDFADFLFNAIKRFDSMPDIMNVGIGHDYTINEYYEAVANILGYTGEFTHDLSKPVGMQQKLVSIDRCEEWGWHSEIGLLDGIRKTCEYYMQNAEVQ